MWNSVALTGLYAAGAAAKIFYAGVNEAGGEFGVYTSTGPDGFGLPGVFGVDYAFINKAAVDTFVDTNKINFFRVGLLLERMCPESTGLGATFDETYFGHFKDALDYITKTKGVYALIDPHNYMRYNNPHQQPMSGSVIGNDSDPTAATTANFAAFWAEMAGRFADNEKVAFGIMNEPHDMPSELVLKNNQAAIDAIRGAGAKQLILAPGNGWTGGHAWTNNYYGTPNSEFMFKLEDPLNNTAIDVHEYFDEDFSGTKQECTKPGPENLEAVTAWLKQYGLKGMITEFGGYPNEGCVQMLNDLLAYMEANDSWIGWTAWAAGPLWGPNSACCSAGTQRGSLEPGSKSSDGSPGSYETVWTPGIQPAVSAGLKRSGMISVDN